eukprot:gnl/TRDRNA2_/TRDRNA2_175359_c0_seq3.p1 gnl/TRDRNA2_/TRDRNA2_175359_c0~~gnl/TRDRNA2_/TRDRNA2_175359_c0_seq3.p1  ORF type:complete len:179 (-),score=31.16 gnl/TRDRNA2_/TRDRNA2_175359_c0_seq3:21-557(-)
MDLGRAVAQVEYELLNVDTKVGEIEKLDDTRLDRTLQRLEAHRVRAQTGSDVVPPPGAEVYEPAGPPWKKKAPVAGLTTEGSQQPSQEKGRHPTSEGAEAMVAATNDVEVISGAGAQQLSHQKGRHATSENAGARVLAANVSGKSLRSAHTEHSGIISEQLSPLQCQLEPAESLARFA